jgi:hypothetical protein
LKLNEIDGVSEVDFSKAQWRLLAQSSPSGLTLDCPVLGTELPVKPVLLNGNKWDKPLISDS